MLLNQHKGDQLRDSILQYCDADQRKAIAKVAKKLEDVEPTLNDLFTWRFFMEKGDIWIISIFQITKGQRYFALSYKMIGKRFQPAHMLILK